MSSIWPWTVLVLMVVRAVLELVILCKKARRHKFEFNSISKEKPPCILCFKALNLTVFVLHSVLLGIFFDQTDRASVNYWLYAMTVYYLLQCYLAFVVQREDNGEADENVAWYVIFFSLGTLSLALLALLWGDFCVVDEAGSCDESQAHYYAALWPLQLISVGIFASVDCILWARGAQARCCPDMMTEYRLQLRPHFQQNNVGYASAGEYNVSSSPDAPFARAHD